MNKKYNIRLQTITPVSIGTDKVTTLSPYADFVVGDEEDEIFYIDEELFVQALFENDLLDEYTSLLSETINNNRSKFNLREFIRNRIHLEVEEVSKFNGLAIPNFGLKAKDRHPIFPIIRSGSKPYIPGSSLKGVIRTALLHHWLQNTAKGMNLLSNTYNEIYNYSESNDFIKFHRLRVKRARQRKLQGHDRREMRTLEKEHEKFIIKLLNEDELFGEFKGSRKNKLTKPPLSQLIQVTDSETLLPTDFGVYQAERLRIEPAKKQQQNNTNTIPQPKEAILPGKEVSFSIILRQLLSETELGNLFRSDPSSLLERIRLWSKACIGLELYHLDIAEDMPNKAARKNLVDFYNGLYDRCEKGEVFIRIGSGKTYFDNSLGVALLNYAEDHHEKGIEAFDLCRKVFFGVNQNQPLFPITRTLATEGNIAMGWVKLSQN